MQLMCMMRESSGKVQNGSMSVIQGISKFRVPVQLQPKPSTLNLIGFEQFVMDHCWRRLRLFFARFGLALLGLAGV